MKPRIILMVTCIASLTACSTLTIDVAVYKGPLVHAPRSRWSEVVGLCRSIRKTADQAANTRWSRIWGTDQVFADLVRLYDGQAPEPVIQFPHGTEATSTNDKTASSDPNCRSIDALFNECTEWVRDNDPNNDDNRGKFRRMRNALMRRAVLFTSEAIGVGHHLGTTDAYVFSQFPWFVPGYSVEMLRVATSIEETAKIARDLADTVLRGRDDDAPNYRQDALAALSSYMSSQSPGTLISIGESGWLLPFIQTLYDKRYWGHINTVEVTGTGDTEYMLIKDEIGNWHLKKALVDPSKVVNAISAGTVAMIDIAAAAGGLPLKLTAPHVVENANYFDKDLNQIMLGSLAEEQELRAAVQQLSLKVEQIESEVAQGTLKDPNEIQKRMQSALDLARAALGS